MKIRNEKELENFMHNVIWLRKHYGISRKKMAELLGIGLWSLNKMERGEFPPKLGVDAFLAVCRNFRIRPSTLLTERFEDGDS